MVNLEYANAYSEVLEILNHISSSEYKKVPKNTIEMFKKNCNQNHKFDYDVSLSLNEQNILPKTKTILAILYRDYFATEYQREMILNKEKVDRQKQEELKQKRYIEEYQMSNEDKINDKVNKKAYNLFKNDNNFKSTSIEKNQNNNLPIERKKIITKIIDFIKSILKK